MENFQISEAALHRIISEANNKLTPKNTPGQNLNSENMKPSKKTRKKYFKLFATVFCLLFILSDAKSYSNILRLTSASGSYSDETIIRLHQDATFDYDSDWDALKLNNSGNTPNFYTKVGVWKYAINSISNDFEEAAISLNLKVAFTGSYTIQATGLDSTFDETYEVILEDKVLNQQIDLRDISEYQFHSSVGDSTNRFILHINKVTEQGSLTSMDNAISQEQVKISIQSDYAYISLQDLHSAYASVAILNINGDVIYNEENISTDSPIEVSLQNYSRGNIYLLRVISNNSSLCKKLYY